MFSAKGPKGLFEATEERRSFLERHSHVVQFGTLMFTLKNLAINALSEQYPLGQKFEATLMEMTKPELGGVQLQTDIGGLLEQRECLQKELANQWFLMLYMNFEVLVSRWCLRALSENGVGNPEQGVREIMMGGAWEAKFCKIQQRFNVDLSGRKLSSWMKDKEWSFTLGEEKLRNPADVLDLYREKRNLIVHSDALDRNSQRVQANTEILLGMMSFLVDFSDLAERAFVKRYGWERTPVTVDYVAPQRDARPSD